MFVYPVPVGLFTRIFTESPVIRGREKVRGIISIFFIPALIVLPPGLDRLV